VLTLITAASLKEYTCKDLAQMAKQRGIAGWHSMRKDELIRALVRKSRSSGAAASRRNGASSPKRAASRPSRTAKTASSSSSSSPKASPARRAPVPPPTDPRVARKIQRAHRQRQQQKELATPAPVRANNTATEAAKDRVVLMVRDPFWLHAYWELTPSAVQRAKAAMAEQWHTAKPLLRLLQVATGSTTSTSERVVRDIEIHGGVQNWYIDVNDPPKGYRVEIGYLGSGGRFHAMARSNSVQTPRPGSSETSVDYNWVDVAENCERIFALSGGYDPDNSTGELQEIFEERFRRPMGSNSPSRFGGGAELSLGRPRDFKVEVDAEMIVFGRTEPDAHVVLAGEPVKLRADGTFSVRVNLPERRQVLPVVCSSSDGMEQRTVVLAVERNTKVMEPILRDSVE
jgi:hypothetical protein